MITEHKALAKQIAEAQSAAAKLNKAGCNLELVTNALEKAARETQARIAHYEATAPAPKPAPKPAPAAPAK